MKIAICDDEKVFIEKILYYVDKIFSKYEKEYDIEEYTNGERLIEECRQKHFETVFLDVDMPELNGFKVAEKLYEINKKVNIIFVSGKESMVFMSYEYRPFWFVPKSNIAMLEFVVERLLQKLTMRENSKKSVIINVEVKKKTEVDFEKILYFKTEDHYVNIFFKDEKSFRSYREKLDNIEKQLCEFWFVRVHNRYLVNCRMISLIEKNSCKLINGENIPISRLKMQDTKKIFQDYCRSVRE